MDHATRSNEIFVSNDILSAPNEHELKNFGKNTEKEDIFRKGSKTYFNSSRFFPDEYRNDVTIFYSFVRVADDLVDKVPQDADGFYHFMDTYMRSLSGGFSGYSVVDDFVSLMEKKGIEPNLVESFFKAMKMDLTKTRYETMAELCDYMHGSAEVIGLIMRRILDLPKVAEEYASLLGRSMQFLNFVRDVREDNELGRMYLPADSARKFGLNSLRENDVKGKEEDFSSFIKENLDIFFEWDREARKGFRFIPKRLLIPIITAQNMYAWTARKIFRNPMIVFRNKVKPSKGRILLEIFKNWFLWKLHYL
ncbi:phytoene/squalene synthase family protein [Oxyplasma meridianum]|uniref:Phytoene/squalene synthase family protein n=1 Tax=Oxyplasma meridianum TaxID=3073602 RepID=A0AAX4NGI3_9ARCH